jgi:hypothetical protein
MFDRKCGVTPQLILQDENPRPFGFAQGRLCLCKKRRDKDGAPAELFPPNPFGQLLSGRLQI